MSQHDGSIGNGMTVQTAQPGAPVGEHFWRNWVLANAIGFGVAAAVLALFGETFWPRLSAPPESMANVVSGVRSLASAIFGAAAISASQWFFLRRRVRWADSWFFATSLGWLVSGFAVPSLVSRPDTVRWSPAWDAAVDALPAILVAWPQWFILRRHISGAGWWIPGSLVGAVSGFVGTLAAYAAAFILAFFLAPFIGDVWFWAAFASLISASLGASISAPTGFVLRQLLKQPVPEAITPPASEIGVD